MELSVQTSQNVITLSVHLETCLDPSCSGNGHCESAQCICESGWKGEDCGQCKDIFDCKHIY